MSILLRHGLLLVDQVTTAPPTTTPPTTEEPTTTAPTTLAPTTLEPTTLAPTTLEPTTLVPTTLQPTTLTPTTLVPTTLPATTLAPTTLPSCICDDTFTGSNGDSPSSIRWTKIGSPDIQNNMVEISIGERLTSKCNLTGDFTTEVDFELQSPPATNSWNAPLWADIDASHAVYIAPAYFSSAKYFQLGWNNGAGWSYFSAGRTNNWGKLRIVRSGNYFSVYYRDGSGAWTQLFIAVTVTGSPVAIMLRCGQWDTNPNITCRFDNYTISDGCPDTLTTAIPTTAVSTTIAPTTLVSTSAPTTLEPTTLPPTTLAPTTLLSTTLAPTTLPPTTLAPSMGVLVGGKLINESILFGRLVQ